LKLLNELAMTLPTSLRVIQKHGSYDNFNNSLTGRATHEM